ncbi:MAG: hypothetical protein RI564_10165 [Gracilimonas sp.]|jgi:hypothetical protein|nr:hypothetical protein [Gracilimonas sp.]
MSLLTKQISVFVAFSCLLLLGCESEKNATYYQKTAADWESYVSEISDSNGVSLENTIILVLKSSECAPAISELKMWDDFISEDNKFSVKLVIIEKYERASQVFLEEQDITLPSFFDTDGLVLERNLLPTTPMKVFINGEGTIEKMGSIDSRSSAKDFLSMGA